MRQLKPTMVAFLDTFNNVTVPALLEAGFTPNVINKREGLANTTNLFSTENPEPVAQVLDDTIDGKGQYNVPIRIFNPNPEKELPVILYYHGGGHLAGSVTVYDPILRLLANRAEAIVVAPEYRLAPESPYPAGEIDARTCFYGVFDILEKKNIKHQKRLTIMGDSGGGALSTALARDVQHDKSVPLENMILIYPSVDYTMSFDSYKPEVNGQGYLLETPGIEWYFDQYFQKGENRRHASPLFGEISSDMPRTLLFSAEFCPLRDENFAYVEKLKEVGVEVEHHNIENMPHTFMNMRDLAKEETDFVYETVKKFLQK
ncbi:alpha/beta hydrolase [Peptoniphilus sp. KCTC 25270]|uniref:alpha/beta hydrolase n=1 Tax=Peptoniphilus sp. KCTC 25270 TaxID=2897414 RepID=UPI001E2F2B8E|nr:alpha/beta hydrolase [Peptoniphilus sp. KCTC 25270]MCD1147467.1 alpha/beta hydrolase [Peptoniphilus sp. KCTC 25270]